MVRTTPVPVRVWHRAASLTESLGLPRSLAIPVWREYRGRTTFQQPLPDVVPPPPVGLAGVRVLTLPGFTSGDHTLAPLADWLRSGGAIVFTSDIGSNLDCGEVVAQAFTARLEALDGPVWLLRHSRGGLAGLVLAQRRPELVTGVVALAGAVAAPFEVHLYVRLIAMGMAWLSRRGVEGLVQDCWDGDCCQIFHDDLLAPPLRPVVNVVGSRDGIIDRAAAFTPGVRTVVVPTTHTGVLTHPASWAAVADALRASPAPPPA